MSAPVHVKMNALKVEFIFEELKNNDLCFNNVKEGEGIYFCFEAINCPFIKSFLSYSYSSISELQIFIYDDSYLGQRASAFCRAPVAIRD